MSNSNRPQNAGVRRWSQEEMVAIMPLVNSMETVTDENSYEFRTKYDRTLSAVTNYVLARRRELAGKKKFKRKTAAYYMRRSLMSSNTPEAPKSEPIQSTGSEVKIPIKNMTVSQDGNGLCLIVKF